MTSSPSRQRHEEVAAHGHAGQRLEVLEIVLVGVGVIGVASIAAHRDAVELAHEVVLEAGARDLPRVEEVLGSDEADDGVDEERAEVARDAVVARLERSSDRRRGGASGRERRAWKPSSKYMTLGPAHWPSLSVISCRLVRQRRRHAKAAQRLLAAPRSIGT